MCPCTQRVIEGRSWLETDHHTFLAFEESELCVILQLILLCLQFGRDLPLGFFFRQGLERAVQLFDCLCVMGLSSRVPSICTFNTDLV